MIHVDESIFPSGPIEPHRAESVSDAVKKLAKSIKEALPDRSNREHLHAPNDLVAIQMIESMIRSLHDLGEYYEFRVRTFPGIDASPWPPPEFDSQKFGALLALSTHFKWIAKLYSDIYTKWRERAVVLWLSGPDRQCLVQAGRTASDLLICFQQAADEMLDTMLPIYRWTYLKMIFLEEVAEEMIALEAAGWIRAHMTITGRLKQALEAEYGPKNAEEGLLEELPGAVAVAMKEHGEVILWRKLVTTATNLITAELCPDGANRKVGKHCGLESFEQLTSTPASGTHPEMWLSNEIRREEHQEFYSTFTSLPLRGGMAALRNLLCQEPELVNHNGRLDSKRAASLLGTTPNQVSVEWSRLRSTLRKPA